MKTTTTIVRVLLGLMMLIFGLNKFLNFLPMDHSGSPEEAMNFMGALFASGYIFPIIAVIEIMAGISLLMNKFQAFTLILLAPVMVNAFLYHLVLDPAGMGASLMAVVLIGFLLYSYRDKYMPMLK